MENNKMVYLTAGAVALLAVGAGVFGFMKLNKPAVPEESRVAVATPLPTKAVKSETLTVNLDAGSFYYKPNVIKAKVGQRVKVVMSSKDMVHDFKIDEFSVAMPMIKAGDTGTVEFTPNKVGSFEFYCSVGQHRAKGMVGTLVVQ